MSAVDDTPRFAGFADPRTNLLDALDAACAERGLAVVVRVPHLAGEGDVMVQSRDAALDADALLRRLGDVPGVARLHADARGLVAQLDDARLAALGVRLEAGGADALQTRALGAGERWTVSFADPNTNKALHVGHLRNLALGHGLASLAQAAGVGVTRQVREGDFGRSMGEALAGVQRHGAGRTPQESGVSGDRFVGDCYARYVRELDTAAPDGPDAALAREQDVRFDAADRLLERWRAGDAEAVELHERVRGWVLEGHAATLARLRIAVDRTLCESDFLAAGEQLVRDGVASGLLEREPGGAVVYDTGEERYPRLLLSRRDGFPTQHLRHLAAWRETRPLFDGQRSIVVVGDEWGPLGRYCRELLARLDPGCELHPTQTLTHGMVDVAGEVVTSASGDALLIDDLLDALAGRAETTALCECTGGCEPELVATMTALGYFLGQPPRKRTTLTLADLLHDGKSIGWSLAQAWASAWEPAHDGAPDPRLDDEAYRYAVVQAQRHRRLLGKCLDELEPLPLVRFHFHLARWFAGVEPTAPLARVMRTILRSGAEALGIASGHGDRKAALA
jgi:tRNA synthetases class I (R)